jgi:SAM-dependent methyltransferase
MSSTHASETVGRVGSFRTPRQTAGPLDSGASPGKQLLGTLLSLSDLAREGIANRGSYRFADHLYQAQPSGRFLAGYCLDAALLRLPAAMAFRRRYLNARDTIANAIRTHAPTRPVRVLTVPCGIPRDAIEAIDQVRRKSPALLDRIEYVGMDIDPEALRVAAEFAAACPLRCITFHLGDALDRARYPAGHFTVVCSTGLAEFLDDGQLASLYRNVYDILERGGVFYTSATASDPFSAWLLRIIDLPTTYRPKPHLESILGCLPWRRVTYEVDPTGLQTFVTAVK